MPKFAERRSRGTPAGRVDARPATDGFTAVDS